MAAYRLRMKLLLAALLAASIGAPALNAQLLGEPPLPPKQKKQKKRLK